VLKMLDQERCKEEKGKRWTRNPRCSRAPTQCTVSWERGLGARIKPRITKEISAVRCWRAEARRYGLTRGARYSTSTCCECIGPTQCRKPLPRLRKQSIWRRRGEEEDRKAVCNHNYQANVQPEHHYIPSRSALDVVAHRMTEREKPAPTILESSCPHNSPQHG
jgi:hypothetical protein